MKYLHVSKEGYTDSISGKTYLRPGKTLILGRNAKKRELRKGLAKKHWPVLDKKYGWNTVDRL
jgi:hypothetical protein